MGWARPLLPRTALLLVLVLAAGCGGAGPGGCRSARDIRLANASATPVEQLRFGDGSPGGWGEDLLAPRGGALAAGSSATLRLPARMPAQAVRIVWVDGRAVESTGIDGCATRRVIVEDAALRVE